MTRAEVSKLVYEYKTSFDMGFTSLEQSMFLNEHFPTIDLKKYYSLFFGTTATVQNGFMITYHCDIVTSIMCCIENRDMKQSEFD